MKGQIFQDDMKQLIRLLGQCHDIAYNLKKRSREPTDEVPTESFHCAGRVFEDPPRPCPGGPRASEKASVQVKEEDGKRRTYTVCKSCKLAKINQTRKKTKNARTEEDEEAKAEDEEE